MHYSMKVYGKMDVYTYVILTSALVGDEWSASIPAHSLRGTEPPVLTGEEAGWAPKSVWTTWGGEKYRLYSDSNPDPLAVRPLCSRYIVFSIPAPLSLEKYIVTTISPIENIVKQYALFLVEHYWQY
jgi:hypothetical protein